MAAKKASKQTKYQAEVQALAQAKYEPQIQALSLLLDQARQDRDSGIAVAQSTGKSVAGLAERSLPQAGKSLSDALTGLSTARTQMPSVQATTGPGANIAAGSMRDMALAQANVGAQGQRTRDELISRQQDARAGAQAAVLGAQAGYQRSAGQISQQATNIAGQQGAFAASELARLLEGDRKRAQRIADREDSQAAAQAGREYSAAESAERQQAGFAFREAHPPKGKTPKARLPGGAVRLTPLQHGKAKDSIGKALTYAKEERSTGATMQQAGSSLKKGVPSVKGVPGIPSFPTIWAQVATQTAYWGGITRNTAKDLHQRGYSYKALGLRIVDPRSAAERAPQ